MGTNEKDMTAGSPGKLIITFAIPMMLGNIFQQLYTMADTMIVGQVVGVNICSDPSGTWKQQISVDRNDSGSSDQCGTGSVICGGFWLGYSRSSSGNRYRTGIFSLVLFDRIT